MHSLLLSLVDFEIVPLLFLFLLFINWECFEIGDKLGPLWKPIPQLPRWPWLWRLAFWLFPSSMNNMFPPKIDYVEVPEGVTNGEFEKPWHKRAWRKRFPELVEPFPKIPPRTKLRVPDEPLPGEWESPWWRIERWWSVFISDIKYRREKKKRGRPATVAPKQVYFPFYG